jgi:phosphate transport system ATP-binding protein
MHATFAAYSAMEQRGIARRALSHCQVSAMKSREATAVPVSSAPLIVPAAPVVLECHIEALHYGTFQAVRDTHIPLEAGAVTAVIGPSGCGKSSLLRCLNRMNDRVRGFNLQGFVKFRGRDIYERAVDPAAVRRHIGMVFQEPNPFTMSIFDNVAFGLRINGYTGDKAPLVEQALRRVTLWDEVKDKLKKSGLSLSGGQQQRLCIARALVTEPEVLLMDEPCSALDPVATRKIEELILELKQRYTIIIVTHNLQQAARVADKTAFMYVDSASGQNTGYLVEYGNTHELFQSPRALATQQYLSGQFS